MLVVHVSPRVGLRGGDRSTCTDSTSGLEVERLFLKLVLLIFPDKHAEQEGSYKPDDKEAKDIVAHLSLLPPIVEEGEKNYEHNEGDEKLSVVHGPLDVRCL